jgi:hypothetical protein
MAMEEAFDLLRGNARMATREGNVGGIGTRVDSDADGLQRRPQALMELLQRLVGFDTRPKDGWASG